jgi:hypothetical protein
VTAASFLKGLRKMHDFQTMDDDDDEIGQSFTAYPCEGDLSHLCERYGCARKGGLSPHSEQNLKANP